MREKGSCVVMGPSVIFLHKYSSVCVCVCVLSTVYYIYYRVIHEKMMYSILAMLNETNIVEMCAVLQAIYLVIFVRKTMP